MRFVWLRPSTCIETTSAFPSSNSGATGIWLRYPMPVFLPCRSTELSSRATPQLPRACVPMFRSRSAQDACPNFIAAFRRFVPLAFVHCGRLVHNVAHEHYHLLPPRVQLPNGYYWSGAFENSNAFGGIFRSIWFCNNAKCRSDGRAGLHSPALSSWPGFSTDAEHVNISDFLISSFSVMGRNKSQRWNLPPSRWVELLPGEHSPVTVHWSGFSDRRWLYWVLFG